MTIQFTNDNLHLKIIWILPICQNKWRSCFFSFDFGAKAGQFTSICILQLYLKYSISSLEHYMRFPCFMHHGELPKASAIQRRQLTISLSYIIVPVVASNPNTGMSFHLNTLIWVQSYHLICPKRWDILQILFLQVKMSAKAGGPMTTQR